MAKLNWILSFLLAISFHIVLGLYYIYNPAISQGARELGNDGFEVSISMTAALAGEEPTPQPVAEEIEETVEEIKEVKEPINEISEEQTPDPVEEVVEEEILEEPIEEIIEEIVEEIPEPVIEEPLKETVEEDSVIFPRPQLKPVNEPKLEIEKPVAQPIKVVEVKEPIPQPKPDPKPVQLETLQQQIKKMKTEEQPQPEKEAVDAPKPTIDSQGSATSNAEVAARSETENRSGGGAFVGQVSPAYKAELRYWLQRHKGYPKFSRRRKQEGVVLLRFTMTREGQVLKHEIRKGSGYKRLDEETIKMLERAQPLPKFPDDMIGDIKTITIPIEFAISR
ncbi:TonB family protein [Curvivirga aplysinae]|uniref:TonB family protein n=1 Tax=Curvivirga aplysinae TaxID=2529852 RepID=UPI0012BB66A1|nr:energy transducer TonB [Curvivirga aplysinae]MTI08720.1 energy transducer TonB [Curvivirga aplysinae]